MTVETKQDRLKFLADFGEPFVSGELTFTGIFDREYNEVISGGEVGFSIPQAQLMCETSDVQTLDQGDVVVRSADSRNYTITDVQNDGTGMTTLILERA